MHAVAPNALQLFVCVILHVIRCDECNYYQLANYSTSFMIKEQLYMDELSIIGLGLGCTKTIMHALLYDEHLPR